MEGEESLYIVCKCSLISLRDFSTKTRINSSLELVAPSSGEGKYLSERLLIIWLFGRYRKFL